MVTATRVRPLSINVSLDNVLNATRANARQCPVAQALKQTTNAEDVWVEPQFIRVDGVLYSPDQRLADAIIDYDNGSNFPLGNYTATAVQ